MNELLNDDLDELIISLGKDYLLDHPSESRDKPTVAYCDYMTYVLRHSAVYLLEYAELFSKYKQNKERLKE